MKRDRDSFLRRESPLRPRVLAAVGTAACSVVLIVVFFVSKAVSIEIPPAAEKKTVVLKQSYQEAARFYAAQCGKCHEAPDPATPDWVKTDCTKGFSKEALAKVRNYMADVRMGKGLYESHCGRCHALIDPGSRTADYWSKNLCTSDECFVKKLHGDEEQQLLLYLSLRSKKN